MALTVTARGTGTHNSSSGQFTLSPASNLAAGSLAVFVIAVDNAETNGEAFTGFMVTDDENNTWFRQVTPLYDPGAANAGVTGAQFTSYMDAGTLTTSSVITVSFDASPTAKAWVLWEVVPAAGKVVAYITGGVNTGSATTTPTVTTSSITSGDVVIGGLHNEYGTAQTVTADADASNGSWSAQQAAEVGTTGTGMNVASQAKVVTGTATQTYNPTLGTSSNVILSWIQLRELPYLTVAGTDYSGDILHNSMALRANTFDFTLKDVGNIFLVDDVVTLAYPYWTGLVTAITTTSPTRSYQFVTLTATNSDVAVVSPAPFSLSDVPNGFTEFGYSDLSVTYSRNQDGSLTYTGVLTTWRAGLWVGMDFVLINANRGGNAGYRVTDVTVTWPTKANPVFRIGFGAAWLTMSGWIESLPRTDAFPASPATDALVYRTDLGMWFFYDGTRWLSQTLYHEHAGPGLGASTNPFSANFTQLGYLTPWHSTYDLWLEDFWTSSYVATTNNGTNFWTLILTKYNSAFSGTTVVSQATSGDTVNTLTTHKTAIGALLTPATYRLLSAAGTKTLSPGDLTLSWAISYRIVAT